MRCERLAPDAMQRVAQALHAVISAEGTVTPTPLEVASVEAIQRHLYLQLPPLAARAGPLPANLGEALPDAAARLQFVRLLAMLPPVDPALPLAKVEVVEAVARQLGVEEYGLGVLRKLALRQHRRILFGLMKRFMDFYWPVSGRPEARSWVSLAWSVMPWFPGLRRWLGLDELLSRYRALASLPMGTLGHAVHRYYAEGGFPIPGSPRSIPEGWARHEVYHILSGYKTTLPGELLLAGFIAGNTAHMALDVALPALVQLHTGRRFAPGPSAEGLLDPDAYFRAVARGASMSVDLLAGWRLWDHAAVLLDEVRERHGIVPFTEAERRALAAQDAIFS